MKVLGAVGGDDSARQDENEGDGLQGCGAKSEEHRSRLFRPTNEVGGL